MTTILYTHPCFLDHDTGGWHPECADRLRAALEIVDQPEFSLLIRKDAPKAQLEDLYRAMTDHVHSILDRSIDNDEHQYIDDTVMSSGSAEAALRAAGAVVAAVDWSSISKPTALSVWSGRPDITPNATEPWDFAS